MASGGSVFGLSRPEFGGPAARAQWAVDGTGTRGSLNSQLLLMGLYEFEHTVEFEVDVRHLARIHGGTKTLLGVPPVDPAALQLVIVCRLVVVEHSLGRMQDLLLLHTDPFQLLDHVVEIAR